jgi:hypothetical protein
VGAAQTPDERVPGCNHLRRAEAFQPSHGSQPRLQPAVISFNPICSRTAPSRAARRAAAHPAYANRQLPCRCSPHAVLGDIPEPGGRTGEWRAAVRSSEASTSITCPYWSTAQYRYIHRPETFTQASSTNQRSPAACRQGGAASMNCWGEPLDPPVDRHMIYLDATLQRVVPRHRGRRVHSAGTNAPRP